MKIFANRKLATSLGNKVKLMKGETKAKVLRTGIISAFIAMSAAGLLTGCGNEKAAVVEDTNTDTIVVEETSQQQPVEEDADKENDGKFHFEWLSDTLLIENLDVDSTLNTQELADQVLEDVGVAEGIAVDENGNIINPEDLEPEVTIDGDYYIAPDGSVWESEADYQAYINQTVDDTGANEDINEDDGYYHAPDGSIWDSEADYQAYINGLNGGEDTTIIIDDGPGTGDNTDAYLAPDGSYWESEQAYLDYINQNGEEITDDTGTNEETVTDDGYYHAPDGSVWSSEAEYQNYINSLNGETGTNSYEDDAEVIVEDFTGYQAPDGSYWESEQEYNDYINSNSQETVVSDEEEAVISNDSEYYVAPDGSYWASEADYNDFINQASVQEEPVQEEVGAGQPVVEETAAPVQEETPVVTDGEVIVAEPDYEAYAKEWDAKAEELNNAGQTAEPVQEEVGAGEDTAAAEKAAAEKAAAEKAAAEQAEREAAEKAAAEQAAREAAEKEAAEKAAREAAEREAAEKAAREAAEREAAEKAAQESSYYTAPDGSVWASKADYDMYMAAEAENTNQK
jgi:heme-degrading monooxygenase HmoA